jgi:hypothetical protein
MISCMWVGSVERPSLVARGWTAAERLGGHEKGNGSSILRM